MGKTTHFLLQSYNLSHWHENYFFERQQRKLSENNSIYHGFLPSSGLPLEIHQIFYFCLVEVVENKAYLMIFPKIKLNSKSSKQSNASCLRLHFYNSERSLSHTLKALSHLFSKKSSIWFVSWFHTIIAVIYSYLGTFNQLMYLFFL